jgi:AraC-like DNA-binding protein
MPPPSRTKSRKITKAVPPPLIRAATLLAQLQALPAVGIEAERVIEAVRAKVGEVPDSPEALIPACAYEEMWRAAQAQYGVPGLPTALALAIPFGAFGSIDYLAGSADSVAGAVASLELHLTAMSPDTRLELRTDSSGDRVVRVSVASANPAVAEEFTLGVLASRFRYLTDGRVLPRKVMLREVPPPPAPASARERMFGARVLYGQPASCLVLSAADFAQRLSSADPYLHATMERMAAQLQLQGSVASSDLEQAIRARLRDALATGAADPRRMARLLGLSERTLQRRLAELDRGFSSIVEQFRREEAALLLSDPRVAVVEVAARLGYAEQTSFTRAFRRWTGTTPAAWRREAAG